MNCRTERRVPRYGVRRALIVWGRIVDHGVRAYDDVQIARRNRALGATAPTEQQILEAKLLIVDDRVESVSLLEEMMATAGYTNVRSVTDPRRAVDTFEEYDPDLVLLDLVMPGHDGFQVMAELREIEGSRLLPVLVLTGQTDRETRLRALGSGARDLLTKPFDLIEVRMRIRSLIESRLLHKQLTLSRSESEHLLLSILPEAVVAELKATGTSQPVRFDSATVLFTDFSGFTQIAEQIAPSQLIEELEVCFTYFDRVAKMYGLQRLKTIGDGYMCAGGIPHANSTHPVDCVLAALQMQRFIDSRGSEMTAAGRKYWKLRIGIHTGPVIAGVVGKEQFAYDVWGDTVNLASRMESSGEAGMINLSEAAYQKIQSLFVCQPRGPIMAKHKGLVNMYFVRGIEPALSEDADGMRVNAEFRDRYERIAAGQ